ncbi:MAG: glutathione peroxidase, partial [Candidatus Moranbacteria bacterium]|nr:glutathione peroxidase [Candidatus Moranbacteria bacterium]
FEILDFPSNQFMNQAPGTNEEIKSFCELTYGTQFETFAKIDVNGKNAIPLYEFLRKQQPKDMMGFRPSMMSKLSQSNKIKWNFTKFLVDRNGNVVHRFAPSYEPQNIEPFIKELL